MRLLAFLFTTSLASCLLAQELDPPSVQDSTSCGAGNVTLTARSAVNDPDLLFEWFRSVNGELELQGALSGVNGESQFITPFLIEDETFSVRIRVRDEVSNRESVEARITYEAWSPQAGKIELCTEVFLEAETNIPQDSITGYQWQILVPKDLGEAFFVDLETLTSNNQRLITSELGFYRVKVTNTEGCVAISGEIEVTDDSVPFAKPVGTGIHCYLLSNPNTHSLTISSEYGRSITEYLWESSLDRVNFVSVSVEKQVEIVKPPSVVSRDTTYYRLTVTEQNCTRTEVDSIFWEPLPEGTIEHTDPGIGFDDFFYCDDDDPSLRTLRANVAPGIEVSWIRLIFIEGVPLEFIKSGVRTLDPLNPDNSLIFQSFQTIGSGSEITLSQSQGGLIMAIFTDPATGCVNYSSNGIFADTAFPFPLNGISLAYPGVNQVCDGDEITFRSYDTSVDEYSWLKLDDGILTEVGTGSELTLDAGTGSVGGVYYLSVTKVGCSGTSFPFEVEVESLPPASINDVFEGEVSICGFSDHAFILANPVSGASYQWLYSPDDVIPYVPAVGADSLIFYKAISSGYYKVEVTLFCSNESDPILVSVNEEGGVADFQAKIEGDSVVCQGSVVELTSTYQSEDAVYFWFYTVDFINFFFLEEETSGTLTLDTFLFGTDLEEDITVDFLVGIVDQGCGSVSDRFQFRLSPNPIIEIRNSVTNDINDLLLCDDSVVDFNLEVFQTTPQEVREVTYRWSRFNPFSLSFEELDEADSVIYFPETPGRYQCSAITQDSICVSLSNTLDIITLPTSIIGDSLFCSGNNINLAVEQGFLPDLSIFTIQWFFSNDSSSFTAIEGATDPLLTISEDSPLYGSGYYYYEIAYEDCSDSSEVTEVTLNDSSFESSLVMEGIQRRGIPFEAMVNASPIDEPLTFGWSPEVFLDYTDGSKAIFTVPESYAEDTLTVSVLITTGTCDVLLERLITITNVDDLVFPSFVSPNGDGLNDYFTITGLDLTANNNLRVIDGWGNTLYEADNFYNQEVETKRLVASLSDEGIYYYLFSTESRSRKGSFYLKR